MADEKIKYRDPGSLVQTDWLAAHLGDPGLRIFDCTTHLKPVEPGSDVPYIVVSGKPEYDAGHIPGAGFLDIQGELSDNSTKLRFTMPSAEHFAAAMSRHGVGEGVRVVLYSAGSIMWATRVWWMLRALGFDHAAVLDGGWDKWRAEGRPVSTEPSAYPPATFISRPRPWDGRRERAGRGGARKIHHGHRKRVAAGIAWRQGSQSLWSSRPRSRQCECTGRDFARFQNEDVCNPGSGAGKVRRGRN